MNRAMAVLAGRLPIVFEDATLVVVNKPSRMLSVPGREMRVTTDTLSRADQWQRAVEKFVSTSTESRAVHPVALHLQGRGKEVPRAETKFINFLRRVSRVEDSAILSQVWEELSACDRELNSEDISKLPTDLVSAADLVEQHCGKRIFHVHRLDCETSGLLCFAKNDQGAASLGEQFRSHEARKVYLARVRGRLACQQGSVELPLCADESHRPKQMVDLAKGKASLTQFQVLDPASELFSAGERIFGPCPSPEFSLVELRPITGRTHQLRVHMLALGNPMLGDSLYDPAYSPEDGDLCLHAMRLAIRHPFTNEALTFDTCHSSGPPSV